MRIEFKGADKLARKLREVVTKYPAAKNQFLRMEAEFLKARVKPLTPVDKGQLRSGWQSTDVQGDEITVYDNVEYAKFVELGHRVKIHGKYTGTVVPGVFMLRDSVDECAERFPADATQILARIFG